MTTLAGENEKQPNLRLARRNAILLALGSLLLIWSIAMVAAPSRTVKSDERVILFPAAAHVSKDGQSWIVPVHGWIFEPEQDDIARNDSMGLLTKALDLPPGVPQSAMFEERFRWFLVDSKRAKAPRIRGLNQSFLPEPSEGDGHFRTTVSFPVGDVDLYSNGKRFRIETVQPDDDNRRFGTNIRLVGSTGVSVISDIDDTIKISHVTDKRELIIKTFFEPFEAVAGMADRYRDWADLGVDFHFVSSSPWQLYEPLSSFLRDAGFPEATYHLKSFRMKGSRFFNLFADPMATRPAEIERILKQWPGRKFVLIGDSFEMDPEVYGVMARRYPAQVIQIYIRNVTAETPQGQRMQNAFEGVSEGKWSLFRDGSILEIPELSEKAE